MLGLDVAVLDEERGVGHGGENSRMWDKAAGYWLLAVGYWLLEMIGKGFLAW
jgi:hypothetical protein